MTRLGLLLTLLLTQLTAARRRERDDRGDVPGWVMITVMSAGLVMALWQVAGDQLGDMLTTALGSVKR